MQDDVELWICQIYNKDEENVMEPSGRIHYQDSYGQLYETEWETINGVIDIISIIRQPYVWGEIENGYIENGIVYKEGVVTINRQVLRLSTDGYIIIAEGTTQVIDYIQTTFTCGIGPLDRFKYHLDCSISDEDEVRITEGPHLSDPSVIGDSSIWADLNPDGTPIDSTDVNVMEWIDVWN